jgi:hypothetical protein
MQPATERATSLKFRHFGEVVSGNPVSLKKNILFNEYDLSIYIRLAPSCDR